VSTLSFKQELLLEKRQISRLIRCCRACTDEDRRREGYATLRLQNQSLELNDMADCLQSCQRGHVWGPSVEHQARASSPDCTASVVDADADDKHEGRGVAKDQGVGAPQYRKVDPAVQSSAHDQSAGYVLCDQL
jgi:hypothetical protein